MKKTIFLAATAALVMSACSNNDSIVEIKNTNKMEFSPLVNAGTRSKNIKKAADIEDFKVWAFTEINGKEDATYVDGEVIIRGGYSDRYDAGTYDNKTYWTYENPENLVYWPAKDVSFKAVSPKEIEATVTADDITIKDYTVGETDILIADMPATHRSKLGSNTVPLTFKHAFSKIMFMATANKNLTVEVEEISLLHIKKTGDFSLEDKWTVKGEVSDVTFPLRGGNKVTITDDEAPKILTDLDKSEFLMNQKLKAHRKTYDGVIRTAGDEVGNPEEDKKNNYLRIKAKITHKTNNGDVVLWDGIGTNRYMYMPFDLSQSHSYGINPNTKYTVTLAFGGGYIQANKDNDPTKPDTDKPLIPNIAPITYAVKEVKWDEASDDAVPVHLERP